MQSFGNKIEECIKKIPENQIIIASELHSKKLNDVPESAFYKTLERLTDRGLLVHLTKGVYCRPRKSKFGTVPISEKEIAAPFIENNKGLVVGYRLFNKYGISTQVSKKCDVLTNAISEDKKNIGSVSLKRLNFKLTPMRVSIVQALEILQSYSGIEDANGEALIKYMNDFARNYSDEEVNFVLKNRKYKKSTIAFMESILNGLSISNTLNAHLSPMSNYKIPRI